MTKIKNKNYDLKIFFLLFVITFTVFIFTSHGHRFTPDEYYAFNQASSIIHQENNIPDFVPGETKPGLQGAGYITASRGVCYNGILCSLTPIGHAATYIPFIIIGENFNFLPSFVLTNDDFDDPHYVAWRNSLLPSETFTYLFYGSIVTALSVGTLFLIIRTYHYSIKTAVIVSFLYGFSTIAWAYSTTGFSIITGTLLILVGFLFYRKFKNEKRTLDLFFAGLSFGFAVAVRYDMLFFVVLVLGFLIYDVIKLKTIKKIAGFLMPLIFFGLLLMVVNDIRYGSYFEFGYGSEEGIIAGHTTPLHVGAFGLLFSPGVGLFVFSPILLLIFISTYDFFKKNKNDMILIMIYLVILLIFFGTFHAWHGLVSWGSRYMISIVPFLLLPLAASIEKREGPFLKITIIGLGAIGAFFSFVWLAQDVSWFVWGLMGSNTGLFALGEAGMHPLRLNPVVFWTFEYSQLTISIDRFFTDLQVNLFLYKALGPSVVISIICAIIIPSSIYLTKILKEDSNYEKYSKKNSKSSETGKSL